jgi:UDP-N-acetyl-D-glucosamine dehydrogenase
MSQETPEQGSWDLVLVHTRHANTDLGWLAKHLVLDATYQP